MASYFPHLELTLDELKAEYCLAMLDGADGNISEAARRLGIYRSSLQRMLGRIPERTRAVLVAVRQRRQNELEVARDPRDGGVDVPRIAPAAQPVDRRL